MWKTILLRTAIIGLSGVLALFGFLLGVQLVSHQLLAGLSWQGGLMLFSLYLCLILALIAAYFLNQLLTFVLEENVFSAEALQKLHQIKRVIGGIWIVFLGILPNFYRYAQLDDAPGMVLLGGALTCLPLIFYIFSAVLEQLLVTSIKLKEEMEWTI